MNCVLPYFSFSFHGSLACSLRMAGSQIPSVLLLPKSASYQATFPRLLCRFCSLISPNYTTRTRNIGICTYMAVLSKLERPGSGIISNAIANAEKLPPQGQENVSLLQQHSTTNKTTPASSQFTFTCDSQVPGTVQWPGKSF